MTYTLTSHGRVLGRTGVELPPPGPDTRSWQFIPAAAFADARDLFAALPAAIEDGQDAIPTPGELADIPAAERDAHVRRLLREDPRMARFLALSAQLDAMALELVDAAGARLDAATIGVTELEIGAEAFRDVLTSVDPSADLGDAGRPPFYLLVAGMTG